jgi:hypothetical protein
MPDLKEGQSMEAVPGKDRRMIVVLGRSESEIELKCCGSQLLVAQFGPELRYHGLALAVPSNTFSISTTADTRSLYIGDLRFTFRPEDWVLIHFRGEIVYNPRFICVTCKLPSGVVLGQRLSESEYHEQIIQCQECAERWYPAIHRSIESIPIPV